MAHYILSLYLNKLFKSKHGSQPHPWMGHFVGDLENIYKAYYQLFKLQQLQVWYCEKKLIIRVIILRKKKTTEHLQISQLSVNKESISIC